MCKELSKLYLRYDVQSNISKNVDVFFTLKSETPFCQKENTVRYLTLSSRDVTIFPS